MIIISRSVIGKRPGLDHVIYPGEQLDVDSGIAEELVGGGYAVYAGEPSVHKQAAPEARTGIDSPEESNVPETPSKGSEGTVDLKEMTYTELKAMAQEMGIETGKLKSKTAMIEAITAELDEYTDDEGIPDLVPQDVID